MSDNGKVTNLDSAMQARKIREHDDRLDVLLDRADSAAAQLRQLGHAVERLDNSIGDIGNDVADANANVLNLAASVRNVVAKLDEKDRRLDAVETEQASQKGQLAMLGKVLGVAITVAGLIAAFAAL